MKRDEAVKILQDRFSDPDLFDPTTIGEDILKYVEKKLKMLPPKHPPFLEYIGRTEFGMEVLDSRNGTVHVIGPDTDLIFDQNF